MIFVLNLKRVAKRMIDGWKIALVFGAIIMLVAGLTSLKPIVVSETEELFIMSSRFMFIFEDEVNENEKSGFYETVKNNSMVYISGVNTLQQAATRIGDEKIGVAEIRNTLRVDFSAGSDIFDVVAKGHTQELTEKIMMGYVETITDKRMKPPHVKNIDTLHESKSAVNLKFMEGQSNLKTNQNTNYIRLIKYSVSGFVIAILLYIVFCIISSIFDRKIRDEDNIYEQFELPILASVNNKAIQYVNLKNIILMTSESENIVVLLEPEGSVIRERVSWNLAAALAKAGKKVLLVDMNFSKVSAEQGLSDMIMDSDILKISKGASGSEADVLYSGTKGEEASSILTPTKFRIACEKLAGQYEYIIYSVESPRISGEGLMLLSQNNRNILVLQKGVSDIVEINRFIRVINSLKSRLLGVVITEKN